LAVESALNTKKTLGAVCFVLLSVSLSDAARADEIQLHGSLGGAHAVGGPQGSEFGFGGGGIGAAEVTFGRVIGIQAEFSALALSSGAPPSNATLAPHSAGLDIGAMGGVRLHPFGRRHVAGLWFDGNGGASFTGTVVRPSFDTHIGYDFRVERTRLDVGPFVGYTQIFQPSDTLVPGDAHILWVGAHFALGAKKARRDRDRDTVFDDEDACPDVPGLRTSDPMTNGCPRGDRDHDLVFDDEDACPDVPGIRTSDSKTNGCPRGDRDHDLVFDDEDACPDVAGIRTEDPRTNGCPRGDRDNDLVFDDEDACPDVPGLRTDDAKTNGCPPAGDRVRLEGDKLVLDDIVHFELDSPNVPEQSWPILRKVAAFINANPDVLEVDIEGHADERGSDEHNMILSRARAETVRRLLVQFDVSSKRIVTHAYGESRPRALGHTELEFRQNRRVEFTVTRARPRQEEVSSSGPPPSSKGAP
jgi:OOP family OmpA-OmpF porin